MQMSRHNTKEWSAADDTALALAARAGDVAAFEEIVRRYQGRVYAAAYRVTGNREDALDTAQDALIKAHRKLSSWEPTGSFLSWLLRLTTNQAIDHVRKRLRRPQEALDEAFVGDTEHAPVEPHVAATDEAVAAREIDERVRGALRVLSPMQRDVFVLRHFEGFSLVEIAGQLGCTVGSVKVHLFRALKKLRSELKDMAPDAPDAREGDT